MGSQLTKNYDVQSNFSTTGGLAELWRVYSATKKNLQRSPVSIFMFDKRVLDRKRTQAEKDEVINALKAEVAALMRVRHPGILQILEPLMEDGKTLAFVTEPVSWSLGYLLRQPALLESAFSDIETRLCLLDLAQALTFLHTEARLIHCAICPDNIYLTPTGFWKLAGLGFCQQILQERQVRISDSLDVLAGSKAMKVAENDVPSKLSPPVLFSAPEIVSSKICTVASDVFSLGLTIYAVYKAAGTTGLTDPHFLQMDEMTETGHRDGLLAALRQMEGKFRVVPQQFHDILAKMLSPDPNSRATLAEFKVSKPFMEQQIKAIYFLDHLQEKQEAQTFQFLKGFSALILKLDGKVLMRRVLPRLLLLLPHETLSAYVLPCILMTLRNCKLPKDLFERDIWPLISKLCGGKEISAQSLYILLSEIDVLLDYTTPDVWKLVLFPLIFKGYECTIAQIQELTLKKTPDIAERITDKNVFKTQLLPRFLQGIVSAKTIPSREAGLQSLATLYPFVDRSTLIETILPCVEKVRRLDMTATIVTHLLVIYEGVAKVLGPRDTAVSILPSVMPLLVESELTTAEFKVILEKIQGMVDFVAQARLQELRIISDDVRDLEENVIEGTTEQQAEKALNELLGNEQEVDLFKEPPEVKRPEVPFQPSIKQVNPPVPEESKSNLEKPVPESQTKPEKKPSFLPVKTTVPPTDARQIEPAASLRESTPNPQPKEIPQTDGLQKSAETPGSTAGRGTKKGGVKVSYKALTEGFFDEFLAGKKT